MWSRRPHGMPRRWPLTQQRLHKLPPGACSEPKQRFLLHLDACGNWQGQLLLCVTSSLVKRARDRGSHLWGRQKLFIHFITYPLSWKPGRHRVSTTCWALTEAETVSPGPALRSSVCREESVWVMTEDSRVSGGWRPGEPPSRTKEEVHAD